MRNRYRSRFNAAEVLFILAIFFVGAIAFFLIDSASGTIVAIDESPGVISDLYKTSYNRLRPNQNLLYRHRLYCRSYLR